MRYRRARALLHMIGLFWLWLWLGSAAFLEGLYHSHSPLHAALAVYAIAVVVLVSLPAALVAALRMILTHPRNDAVVVHLPRVHEPLSDSELEWYDERVS